MLWGRPLPVEPADLPRLWRSLDVTIAAPIPPSFDADWSVGGRVRGALGHVLHDGDELETPRARARRERLGLPSVYELIHAGRYLAPPKVSAFARAPARPVVLAVQEQRRRLVVTVRLFGTAMLYQRQMEAALVRTVENGIAIAIGARSRARLRPDSLTTTAPVLDGAVPPDARGLCLRLRSPLSMLRGSVLRTDPTDVMGSLISRAAALAAWQGLALAGDPAPFAGELDGWDCRWEDCTSVAWERRSTAQPHRSIPMLGLVGRLKIKGRVEHWLPLLSLAPLTHIGSHTTFGMGAVDVDAATGD